jgi:tetratricopeptide (TPR) repeat protein
MTTARVVTTMALVVAGLLEGRPAAQGDSSPAFRQWTDAVMQHVPGTADEAMRTAASFTPEGRRLLVRRLAEFIDGFAATDIAHALTLAQFLDRAAMLHADVAMFDSHRALVPGALPARSSPGTPTYATTNDGEFTGSALGDWNWPFARALLARITPSPGADPFVGLWYHATAAYLFRNGEFGEVATHLEDAARLLPQDARILFDRGCLAEALSMNLFQQLVEDAPEHWVFAASGQAIKQPPPRVVLPSAQDGNARAAEFYRRALIVDPQLDEARVRLARLLEGDKHYADADRELATALEAPPDRAVAFYAHLLGARAAEAQGQPEGAQAHVQAALALFPHAESAWLAASHLALLNGDADGALSALDDLAADPPNLDRSTTDPWSQYPYGVGRMAELVLTELWRAVPRVPVS